MAQCSQEECNLLVFEAVYENSFDKWQSAMGRYDLNQLLKSLSTCNQNGESPMVVAIKGRNVFIIEKLVKLFLECVAKEKRRTMRCSSRCVIVIEKMQKIPILEWLGFFLDDLCDQERLKNIAQILSNYPTSNQQDEIIALELVGAVLLNVVSNEEMIETGLGCWKKAMTIRYLPDSNGEPLYPKVLVTQDQSAASKVVFGSAVEVNSMEELDLLLQRPERENNGFFLRIQGLIVLRRIALQANAGPYWVYLKSLFGLASEIMYKNITYAVNTYLLIMDQLIGFDPHQLSTKTLQVFIDTLFDFGVQIYFDPHDEAGEAEPVRRELSVPEKLIHITKFINTVVKFFPNPEMIADLQNMSEQSSLRTAYSSEVAFGEIICALMLMMETTTQQMTNQEEEELEKNFSYYIQNLFPERTTTPLHTAARIHHSDYDEHDFEEGLHGITFEILCKSVKRMLKLGADPNALNESGETPLHIELWDADLPDMPRPIFQALVNAGGHLDLADDYGKTVIVC
jgi:hypothetical protein